MFPTTLGPFTPATFAAFSTRENAGPITILALASWVSRQTDLTGNCAIEILQFQIQILIQKGNN